MRGGNRLAAKKIGKRCKLEKNGNKKIVHDVLK